MNKIQTIKDKTYGLLRKTQKYTGTDNVYLAKGGFWLTLGQIISSAAGFLLAMAFGRLLDPATYGNYRYIISLAEILVIFTLYGINTAVTQAVARNLEGSFYTGFKTKLKWGSLGGLAAIAVASYYWIRGNEILPVPRLVAAMFFPLMYSAGIYNGFLAGKKLFNVQAKYNIANQIIATGAMIATLFFTKNLFWLIAVYFVSHAFLNYFFYLLTKFKFRPNKKEDPQSLSYGKHLSLMQVFSVIADQSDKILLFNLTGSGPLAVYQFALIIPDQIRDILKSVGTLAFPKLAEKSSQEIKANIKEKSFKLFLLASVIIIAYMIAAPHIYKIFFPRYLDSIYYSQIYILSLLAFPFVLFDTSFTAKAKKKELYLLQIAPSVFQMILYVGLIPFLGIMGVLIALLGRKVFSIILTLFLFRKF